MRDIRHSSFDVRVHSPFSVPRSALPCPGGPTMRAALTAGLLLLPLAPVLADPLPERANQVVDYRISVRLDAATHRLDGRERVVWRNPSADAVSELWFHLYLNAFKNTKSTFMKESGGQFRSDRVA